MATADFMIDRWSTWVNSWTALSLPGACWAALVWGPATASGIAATVAGPLAVVLILVGNGQPGARPTSGPGARWIGRVVLCGVTLVLSVSIIGGVVPGLTYLIVLLAGVTTPPVAELRRRALGHTGPSGARPTATSTRATPPQSPPSRPGPAAIARAMTDMQLCRAWCQSFWLLGDARDADETLALVVMRQGLLDELETRNAAALEAWLASGARPSQGLERFLIDDGDGHHTAV